MTYSEKLQDPRWQKKRLEVFEQAGWKCERCDSKDKTMHVHHGYYEKGIEPWGYDNSTLHCLCWECHEVIQERTQEAYRKIAQLPAKALYAFELELKRFGKFCDSVVEINLNQ